ncbi:MAG: hypothetical protein KJ049_09075 [Gammaproteobacteria bacterium]|nr:hypothetical protein [Gammaproteobacteria bacterium]
MAKAPSSSTDPERLSAADFAEVVQAYRDWRKFDRARSPSAERAALKRIDRLLSAAAQCLQELSTGGVDVTDETPARSAWRKINMLAQEREMMGPTFHASTTADVLLQWAALATPAADLVPRNRAVTTSAARIAADRLVCLRDARGLKSSAYRQGATVAELHAAGVEAGDLHFTLDAAHKAVKAATRKPGRNRTPPSSD